MKTIFISDLHLEEKQPKSAQLFLDFLQNEASKAQALYILGDFFEMWVGDDNQSEFNLTIIHALKEVTEKGVPIYLMHGNRDFLLGKDFLKDSGCKLLPDEYVINLYGTPTLLMHGDTLCTLDKHYLKFRKKTRLRWLQKIFLWVSLKKRLLIAEKMRIASKKHLSHTDEEIMDVTQTEVIRVMQKHGVQHLIHGHTHKEGIHHFSVQHLPATRTVLGAWHTHGSALVCDSNGKKQLIVI